MQLRRNIKLDVQGLPIGRVAQSIAKLLLNKDTPVDYLTTVIIDNWQFINVKKNTLITHSGYIGNLKEKKFSTILQERPLYLLQRVVRCMLPKNKTRYNLLRQIILNNAIHNSQT